MPRTVLLTVVGALCGTCLFAADDLPRSHDPRIGITLFAENPRIVTPTGIDVDSSGRVWAIESNTHFPPENYKGHPTDRVLVMTDLDGDGRCDESVVFLDGLVHTMSVAVHPAWLNLPGDGGKPPLVVYLATRKEIFRCVDADGDLVCDEKVSIVRLDTPGNYPHNGLAGFAFDPLGHLFFGFGENLGEEYSLTGSDGRTLKGGGEGGNIYRSRPDGSELKLWATGFWNPHANAFDAQGRLFSVDNDPDSRPPCRLMHIISGGDYGYRFRNGRKGLHPFTSWNGEIAGTLPMVAGTGEAPSGILAYANSAFPEEYRDRLIVTSWGDHRVDTFLLRPRGASVGSATEPLVSGGENFRPVGIAGAPDGSLFCTDWVLRDYKLHGRGRVWKIHARAPLPQPVLDLGQLMAGTVDDWKDLAVLGNPRIDVRRCAARLLARTDVGRKFLEEMLVADVKSDQAREIRLECLWALAADPAGRERISTRFAGLLNDADPIFASAVADLRASLSLDIPREAIESRRNALIADGLHDPAAMSLDLSLVGGLHLRSLADLQAEVATNDPFLLMAVVQQASRLPVEEHQSAWTRKDPAADGRLRLAATLAARHKAGDVTVLRLALKDTDPLVRRVAVQWIAESGLKDFRPAVEKILDDPRITSDLFLATLAALEMLDGVPPEDFDKAPPGKYVLPIVRDPKRSSTVRALALRLVPPADPSLDTSLLETLVRGDDLNLRREAVRTLQFSPATEVGGLLREMAETSDKGLQLDAIAALAGPAQLEKPGGPSRKLLADFIASPTSEEARREALRSARELADPAISKAAETLKGTGNLELQSQVARTLGGKDSDSPLKTVAVLRNALLSNQETGDPEAGRRLFYHLKGPGCSNCHTVNGRGGRIGPDLSTIGRSLTREKLVESILEPSKEVAPQFVTWAMETTGGKVLTGMIVFENEGKLTLGSTDGKTFELPTLEVVDRRPQEKSVMPENLAERMTLQELRDLLAFLQALPVE